MRRLAPAAAAGLLVLLAAVPAGAQDAFLVPTGAGSAGFGPFDGAGAPRELRRIFGPPTSTRRETPSCRLRYRSLGLTARFVAFGTATRPCRNGTFVEARLTDRRWHTDTGLRPGARERAARRLSKRRCRRRTCGFTGYALELHRNECAGTRTPGVIAHVVRGRVKQLVVLWRGCE